ncbi:hypothetical protein [Fodinibius sp. Rm-B-1B1-1]|uniref:hypothetical protein n=1 Tax=Fodinibius alkaliphilus TaxID=3140241 RepID=UPI003159FFE7
MVSTSYQMHLRTYLSLDLIKSAAFFARKAHEYEQSDKPTNPKQKVDFLAEHKSFVLGSIFKSVTFLEALINEIYCDINENVDKFDNVNKSKLELISRLWDKGIPRTASYPILQKYEIFLDLLDKDEFNRGVEFYSNAKFLIILRNALIHFEPESILADVTPPSDPKDKHKFEKYLKGKFNENPFTGDGNPFYPDKCLGHGCAEWSVKSSLEFTDVFFKKINEEPDYDIIRTSLKTKS